MRKRLVQYETLLWRTGRTVGRTIYAVMGVVPNDHDPLIGVMDTRALAEAAVRAHNLQMVKKIGSRQP
jgi:hypothetical protein